MIAMMLIVFLVLLLLGVSVAFSLGIPTMIYFFLNQGTIPIEFMAHTMTNPLFNYVLIALPAFLLSGRMMNGAGVTERIFNLAKALVGRFRGGLVYTNIIASMLFASMSGTAVGDAGGLGAIEIDMMDRAGYKRKSPQASQPRRAFSVRSFRRLSTWSSLAPPRRSPSASSSWAALFPALLWPLL